VADLMGQFLVLRCIAWGGRIASLIWLSPYYSLDVSLGSRLRAHSDGQSGLCRHLVYEES